MKMNAFKIIYFGIIVLQFFYFGSCVNAQEYNQESQVVIAVVEPREGKHVKHELNYSVSIDKSNMVTTLNILNGLGEKIEANREKGLAILIQKDIPVGVLSELISMAGKSGYSAEKIYVFIYSSERWMMSIPGYKTVRFTTDPIELSKYLEMK